LFCHYYHPHLFADGFLAQCLVLVKILAFATFAERVAGNNLMEYLPKEICDKLKKMGCEPSLDIYRGIPKWILYEEYNKYLLCQWVPYPNLRVIDEVDCFTPWDFIGTSERARKNAEILWPIEGFDHSVDYLPHGSDIDGYDARFYWCSNHLMHRHAAIDSPDAVAYISKFVK